MIMSPAEFIKSKIRTIPDFPKKGIQFRDITTLLSDAGSLKATIDLLYERYHESNISRIAAIEARGFIIGAALAYKLGTGFVPIRKKGKLPGHTIEMSYELEYGTDTIAIHDDALTKDDRVLLIDDLLATGGTAIAAARLVEKTGAFLHEIAVIVDLPQLNGSHKLKAEGYKIFAICEFEGE